MAEAEKELVSSPRRKILRFCLVSLIVVVCVYVTLYASVLMLAARKEAEIKQRLKDLVPNVKQLADQQASVEENETARMMREWGEKERAFGVYDDAIYISGQNLYFNPEYFFHQATLSDKEEILLGFKPFIDGQQEFVNRFHIQADQNAPKLRVRFNEVGINEGFEVVYSKALGLLLLDTLLKIKQKDRDSAFRSLKTAWVLIETFRAYPSISARAIALEYQTFLVQMVRELDFIPAQWKSRISEFDYRANWKELQAVDLWKYLRFIKKKSNCYSFFSPQLLLGRHGQYFANGIWPFFWLCALNRSEIYINELEWQVAHVPHPCWGTNVDRIEINNKLPAWNRWHEQTWPIYNPFGQIARLEFETERTQLILHFKELQQKSPAGKLPVTLPKIESKVCPGEYWEYQLQPDGTPILKFSQPIEDSEFKL